jgi:hypothetical protein
MQVNSSIGLVAAGLMPLKWLHNFSRRLPHESMELGGRLLYHVWAMSWAMITKDFAMVNSSPPAITTAAS